MSIGDSTIVDFVNDRLDGPNARSIEERAKCDPRMADRIRRARELSDRVKSRLSRELVTH